MPNVGGKKFPYTKSGMAAAKKYAESKKKPGMNPRGRAKKRTAGSGVARRGMNYGGGRKPGNAR